MESPMPVFVIKGKDRLSVATIEAYRDLCNEHGLHDQAAQVDRAIGEFRTWQEANPDHVKDPDHPHVPTTGVPTVDELRAGSRWRPTDPQIRPVS